MDLIEENIPYLISCKPLAKEYEHLAEIKLTPDFTLGRSLNNSAVITYLGISRNHCKFYKLSQNEWAIEDNSTFGIEINDLKVVKGIKTKILHNDFIKLEPSNQFTYKFVVKDEIPTKRFKINTNSDYDNTIDDYKSKFELSQNFNLNYMKEKINEAKLTQSKYLIEKQKIQSDMNIKIKQLDFECVNKLNDLQGKDNEIESKKAYLLKEKDLLISKLKIDMEAKIAELSKEIEVQRKLETKLQEENKLLKEKLVSEKEDFMAELNKESLSKQGQLEILESKLKQQEDTSKEEKKILEETLRKETEKMQLEIQAEKDIILQKKEEIENQLKLEKINFEKSIAELKMCIKQKDDELAALLMKKTDQSDDVIFVSEEKSASSTNRLEENPLEKVNDIMENELQCSICNELFINTVTLNCSHSFCSYCIERWSEKNKSCPNCRTLISTKTKSLAIDTFIDKMVQNLPDKIKEKRKDLLKSRDESEKLKASKEKPRKHRRVDCSDQESSEETEEQSSEEDSEEEAEDYDEFGDFLESDDDFFAAGYECFSRPYRVRGRSPGLLRGMIVPGNPAAPYGGYGCCYRCGAMGHWAPGCPLNTL